MNRVNMSFRRSSGTLQALPSALIISLLQYLDASACRLYLLLGRLREGVRPHSDGTPDLPAPENLDQLLFLSDYACRLELPDLDRRVDLGAGNGMRPACHALEARQPALQGHLAALVGLVRLRARTGL